MAAVDIAVSSAVEGEEPEDYIFTFNYPDGQGMAAYRLMQMMGEEMEALYRDEETAIMGTFVQEMFATGDATLDPTLVYSEESAAEIMEAARATAHEPTTSTEAQATVEATPGVAVTIDLIYTWPKNSGGRAMGALQHIFKEENTTPFLTKLLSSGDASVLASLMAPEDENSL